MLKTAFFSLFQLPFAFCFSLAPMGGPGWGHLLCARNCTKMFIYIANPRFSHYYPHFKDDETDHESFKSLLKVKNIADSHNHWFLTILLYTYFLMQKCRLHQASWQRFFYISNWAGLQGGAGYSLMFRSETDLSQVLFKIPDLASVAWVGGGGGSCKCGSERESQDWKSPLWRLQTTEQLQVLLVINRSAVVANTSART